MTVSSRDAGKRRLIDWTPVVTDLRAICGWLAQLVSRRPRWPRYDGGQCPLDELSEFHIHDIGLKRFEHHAMWADSRGAPLTAVREFEYRQR